MGVNVDWYKFLKEFCYYIISGLGFLRVFILWVKVWVIKDRIGFFDVWFLFVRDSLDIC